MTIEHFEATERYMSQLPGSEVFEDLTSIMDSPVEAAASLVMLTATTYCLGMTRGQERQYLADWHASLRNECSAVYAHLREVHPDRSRAEINAIPDLELLNGIRRGVRRALVQSHHLSEIVSQITKTLPV